MINDSYDRTFRATRTETSAPFTPRLLDHFLGHVRFASLKHSITDPAAKRWRQERFGFVKCHRAGLRPAQNLLRDPLAEPQCSQLRKEALEPTLKANCR